MRHPLIFGIVGAWLLFAPSGSDAQIRIEGRVVDDQDLSPVSGAEVRIATERGRTLGQAYSDDEGLFTFNVRDDGGYVFRASRIGYEEAETPILWTDGFRTYDIEIRLHPDAVLLAPIEVLARSRDYDSHVLQNFRHRLDAGMGHYFTREDIERIRPARVTDLLDRVPGVRLVSSGAGLRREVRMSRGARECRAEIFVDGFRWNRPLPGAVVGQADFTVDDAVSPSSVLGIEVYLGLSTIPAEFITPRAMCGVIAIWTRRG